MGNEDLKLTDIIDINYLQALQDAFSDATGMASISVDMNGVGITKPSNFHDFCIKYTRGCSEGLRRCEECDKHGGDEALAKGRPAVYSCHAGLTDFGVPIIYDGRHIGSIIGGQVITHEPDEDYFGDVARELGIDPEKYVESVRKIPILTDKQVRGAANLLGLIATKVCEQANANFKLEENNKIVEGNVETIKGVLKEFYEDSETLNRSQTELSSEIDKITKLLKEINNVAKLVSSIADETQMISFNASIEAARAGEQGKSFTIIAGEIRNLSEQSKDMVANVQNFTSNIGSSVQKTSLYSKKCVEAINNELEGLKSIEEGVNKIRECFLNKM